MAINQLLVVMTSFVFTRDKLPCNQDVKVVKKVCSVIYFSLDSIINNLLHEF